MASSDPPKATLHIGTRKSPLALKQTELVVASLQSLHPSRTFEVHAMATAGDKDQVSSLYTMGKGLWTSELEAKLMNNELDMVVHCLKDLPTTLPSGCAIGCITSREDPRDVLVVKKSLVGQRGYTSLAALPAGSVIGTSSVRRIAQLKARYPRLRFADVRGNIQTRLRKLDSKEEGEQHYAALVLAAAGLLRMGYGDRVTEYLEGDKGGMLYAVGQGALAIEVRDGDQAVIDVLRGLEEMKTTLACRAERSVMRELEGGCSVPIGVETRWVDGGEENRLKLSAIVVQLDGSEVVTVDMTENVTSEDEADKFGKAVADALVAKGAGKILDAISKSKKEAAEATGTASAAVTAAIT